jgi:hypothetical protein
MVNEITVSPHDPATAYAAVSRYKVNDFTPLAYVTHDYGQSWDRITNGFDDDAWVHVVREDPKRAGLLYAGTETGMYVSFDGGDHWQSLQLNLPNTPINDVMVHERENDLIVATSGRSFWILDDLSPLQQAADAASSQSEGGHFLIEPRHAYRLAGGGGFGGGGEGQNPPNGAVLDFVLGDLDEGQEVKIEIRTQAGDLVRTHSTKPDEELSPGARPLQVHPGHNRITWNLRHESIPNIPGAYVFGSLLGRRVIPGTYDVRLVVGEWMMGRPLEVRMDPRTDATMADYVEQDAFVAGVAAELAAIHDAVTRNNDVRGQVESLLERIEGEEGADEVSEAGEALAGDLETVADSLYQRRVVDGQTVINFPSRLKFQYVFLHGNASGAEGEVSMGSRDVLGDLRARWTVHQATNDELLGPRLDAFNRLAAEAGFSVIIAPPRPRRPVS